MVMTLFMVAAALALFGFGGLLIWDSRRPWNRESPGSWILCFIGVFEVVGGLMCCFAAYCYLLGALT